jgi:hypothetical protein
LRKRREFPRLLGPVVLWKVGGTFAQYRFHNIVVADPEQCVRCRVGHDCRLLVATTLELQIT